MGEKKINWHSRRHGKRIRFSLSTQNDEGLARIPSWSTCT